MTTILIGQPEQDAVIPNWVIDLDAFRRWATSDDFPESGQYSYLGGSLWVDGSMERLQHNELKTEFTGVLYTLVKSGESGKVYADGMLLSHVGADLATEPDAMFASFESLKNGKLTFVKGPQSLEAIGTPDMVLEIVSPTSRRKDTVLLRDLYYRAGIPEYWVIRRGDRLNFEILRWTPDGYAPAAIIDGWAESETFKKSFRLSRGVDPLGGATYQLEVR